MGLVFDEHCLALNWDPSTDHNGFPSGEHTIDSPEELPFQQCHA